MFDLFSAAIDVGEAAGCGLSGTANLGYHGADDPRRSQEPPALSAQRSKHLLSSKIHTRTRLSFISHTNTPPRKMIHYTKLALLRRNTMIYNSFHVLGTANILFKFYCF